MRRLIEHIERSWTAHRETGERGASTILVAMSMVVMLGFTALAIDVGAMYHERAELQSGADAAVLAVAQDCGMGVNCTGPAAHPTAQQYAEKNAKDGAVNVAEPVFTGSTVRVNVSTRAQSGAGSLALTFAPILGVNEATVGATSAAQVITPNKGPAVLPIVISPCDFDPSLSAGPQVLKLHSITGSNKNATECGKKSATSGLNIPGGFGFIDTPSSTVCTTTVSVDQTATSDPGNDLPSQCEAVLQQHVGKTILLPLYKDLGASGNKGWYKIDGWVAFKLLGWRFPSTSYANTTHSGATCSNPCTGIIGEFEKFASIDSGFTSGGPDYGASVVTMIE
ncbi:pilus assembly protein TadG-related protein [Kocuria sp. M1R5S2]|uniref:pilus assembly protein TadG-related protein n=1 Tax=Kocuria rhizosphaerae TaxID=3376285 RepID=UPI0037B62DD2